MKKKIIRVWALMRSGHHAIIDWIFYNLNSPKIFINNCRNKTKFHYVVVNEFGNKPKKFKLKELSNFKNIIVNFEHKNLNICKDSNWGNLKKIAKPIDVVVVRDPFNWVASSLSKKTFKQPININMDLWKQYANECLKENLISNRIPIKFNDWFSNSEYRKLIADRLKISNDEYIINKISTRSSFDGYKFKKNAQDMKVLERWKKFKNDKRFLSHVNHKDVKKLSKKLFEVDILNEI